MGLISEYLQCINLTCCLIELYEDLLTVSVTKQIKLEAVEYLSGWISKCNFRYTRTRHNYIVGIAYGRDTKRNVNLQCQSIRETLFHGTMAHRRFIFLVGS